MTDDLAGPVKGIVKAFDNGVKLSKRVSRSARSTSATQALQIAESAHNLENGLERNSKVIGDAYRDCLGTCGQIFAKTLVEDGEPYDDIIEIPLLMRTISLDSKPVERSQTQPHRSDRRMREVRGES